MRKLLLASAATVGALAVTIGSASAQPKLPVAAGTLSVHLNGYLQFQIAGFNSSYNNLTVPGVPKGSTLVTGAAAAGTYKLNDITTSAEFRLYPGFDGMTRDGLGYGAQAEIRTNASDAGVGANRIVGSGSSSGSTSLFVRRAYGYLGTVDAGYARVGQTDSAFTLLQTGVIEAFGDGAQWPGDGTTVTLLPTAGVPSNFIYADTGNLYATDKVVYISPAIAGFSLAAGYEPNSNGIKEGYGNCGTAASVSGTGTATTCADESSSPLAGDIGKRRKNTIDAAVQYVLKYNGAAIKANGGILYGAPIDYTGAPVVTSSKSPSALQYGYDPLEVYQAGAQVTYAGFTLGANIKGGQVEDGYAFKPKGARNAFSYIISGNYVLGPIVVGASYWNGQTAGAYVPDSKVARTLSEYGVAAGGNYVFTPDISLFVQYLYGHRHQPGNAFGGSTSYTTPVVGSATPTTTKTNLGSVGNAQVQAVAAGVTLKW